MSNEINKIGRKRKYSTVEEARAAKKRTAEEYQRNKIIRLSLNLPLQYGYLKDAFLNSVEGNSFTEKFKNLIECYAKENNLSIDNTSNAQVKNKTEIG